MKFLGLDFETKDPYLGKDIDLGPGFPFAVNYPYASLFYPIGWSECYYDSESDYLTQSQYFQLSTKSLQGSLTHPNLDLLKETIKNTTHIICHNAQYDLGCLLALGISIDHLKVYDTKVIAKLYDSSLFNYSLSALLTRYRLGKKMSGSLSDIVKRHQLLRTTSGKAVNTETKTYNERARKFAYAHMDLLQELEPETMAFYANHDTLGMMQLFRFIWPKVGDELSAKYSKIQKICTKMRVKGIAVSMENAYKAEEIMAPILLELEQKIYKAVGREFNIRSTQQLPEALIELGYKLPETAAGNPSLNKEFIEENPNDELLRIIGEFRTVDILLNHFIRKAINMQKYSCPDIQGSKCGLGRVFPEMNLLEARTGRFSSSNPNIQNIPKRNKIYAKLCRAIFVPDNSDKKWISLDWANQEGRMQLHFAVLKDFDKADEWKERFIENPAIDTHELVAEMMYNVKAPPKDSPQRVDFDADYRTPAKTIYLGKSFCMGRAKTAKRLGLPTELVETQRGPMETSGPEATKLIQAYEKAFPYLTELQKDCMSTIVNRGYIRTIGGRQCRRPPMIGGKNYDYKAISLLIQGSAADQMYDALEAAYDLGLDIKCIVHDEFNIEGTEEDALKMKDIMENKMKLEVPSLAEVSVGDSWGSTKRVNL